MILIALRKGQLYSRGPTQCTDLQTERSREKRETTGVKKNRVRVVCITQGRSFFYN